MENLELRFDRKSVRLVNADTENIQADLGKIRKAAWLTLEARYRAKRHILTAGSFLALYGGTGAFVATAIVGGKIDLIHVVAGLVTVFDAPHRILDLISGLSDYKFCSRILRVFPGAVDLKEISKPRSPFRLKI